MYDDNYVIDLVSSILLLAVFWGGAFINLLNWHTAKAYIQSEGATFYPSFVLAVGILWQIIGGALLLNPLTVDLGCIILILFTLISSLQFHQFWRKEGIEKHKSLISFLSNVGVMGGLFLIMSRSEALRFPFQFLLP